MFSSYAKSHKDAVDVFKKWLPPVMDQGFLLSLFVVVMAGAAAGGAAAAAAASAATVTRCAFSDVDAAMSAVLKHFDDVEAVSGMDLSDDATEEERECHRALIRERIEKKCAKIQKVKNGSAEGLVATLSHPSVIVVALSVCAVIVSSNGGPGWLVLGENGNDFANTILAEQISSSTSVKAVLAQVDSEIASYIFNLFKDNFKASTNSKHMYSFKEAISQESSGGAAAEHGHRFAWREKSCKKDHASVTVHTRCAGFCATQFMVDSFSGLDTVIGGTIVTRATLSLILRGGISLHTNLVTDALKKVSASQ